MCTDLCVGFLFLTSEHYEIIRAGGREFLQKKRLSSLHWHVVSSWSIKELMRHLSSCVNEDFPRLQGNKISSRTLRAMVGAPTKSRDSGNLVQYYNWIGGSFFSRIHVPCTYELDLRRFVKQIFKTGVKKNKTVPKIDFSCKKLVETVVGRALAWYTLALVCKQNNRVFISS